MKIINLIYKYHSTKNFMLNFTILAFITEHILISDLNN